MKIDRETKVKIELSGTEFIVIRRLIESATGGEQQILALNRTDSLDVLKDFLKKSKGVI